MLATTLFHVGSWYDCFRASIAAADGVHMLRGVAR